MKEKRQKNKNQDKIEEICDVLINDLKDLRESKGLTTAQLAAITGIAQPNLTRLETCGNPEKPSYPNLNTIANIAHALGAKVRVVVDEV